MIGRRDGMTGGGVNGGGVNGGGGSGGRTSAASTRVAGRGGADTGAGAATGAMVGSFRLEDGTSARGASCATRASISRRLRPQALASTASWFSRVRCGRRIRTEVRDTAPEASRSRIIGKSRQARAAWIRLQVASSESRSTSVHYVAAAVMLRHRLKALASAPYPASRRHIIFPTAP